MPLISVCIPTYNGKQHLAACIGSVLSQTFTDFEVLICDDQSSDGTLDFARQLARGDERFRFIPNPRRFGLVGNWNNCVRQAHGEWIKFVFQDDVVEPSCFEKLLAACRRHDKPFGFCERNLIFEDGTPAPVRDWFIGHKERLHLLWQGGPVINPKDVARSLAHDPVLNIVGEPTATLIKKSVFAEIGDFDEALIQMCDSEFWFRTMINYGAAFVPETLAVFRLHAAATTARNHGRREYRTKVLDPLVVRYRLAFGRHYRSLRQHQATEKSALSRCIECAMFAAYARRQLKERIPSNKRSDEDLFAEWKSVVVQYPGIRILA